MAQGGSERTSANSTWPTAGGGIGRERRPPDGRDERKRREHGERAERAAE
jgi:hypothetical protein